MQPESRLNKAIKAHCKKRGARVVKIHGGDNFQEAGISDFLGCYRGYFLALETKTPTGGEPRPRQQYFLDSITAAGGYAKAVRSVEDVEAVLAEIDRKEAICEGYSLSQ